MEIVVFPTDKTIPRTRNDTGTFFKNHLYKSEKLCYNNPATQLNSPISGKHPLVKGVSLFPFPEKWQGCVAAMRDSLFQCVSFEAHFLIVHKYFSKNPNFCAKKSVYIDETVFLQT
ncbi:MAG: hypothetical protein IIX86_00310 [Clostridia bacterium]|nr:hypothetical protein [Clostridia bacterium]